MPASFGPSSAASPLHLSWVLPLPYRPPTPTPLPPSFAYSLLPNPWLGYRPLSCTLPAGLPRHSQLSERGRDSYPSLSSHLQPQLPHPQCLTHGPRRPLSHPFILPHQLMTKGYDPPHAISCASPFLFAPPHSLQPGHFSGSSGLQPCLLLDTAVALQASANMTRHSWAWK